MSRKQLSVTTKQTGRAQGCLLGQLAGDALGSLVEFQWPYDIKAKYPNGVRMMADGGTWNTIAGQPTDDSEMALALARTIIEMRGYDANAAARAYAWWYGTNPFDMGGTISRAIGPVAVDHKGTTEPAEIAWQYANPGSQANGALMRICPLGIYGAGAAPKDIANWARQDAVLTHPHPVCQQANALFSMAIAEVIRTGSAPQVLHGMILVWAQEMGAANSLIQVIEDSAMSPPQDYISQQGWVLVAFQNALYQLLHADNVEDGIVDTIMRGGERGPP